MTRVPTIPGGLATPPDPSKLYLVGISGGTSSLLPNTEARGVVYKDDFRFEQGKEICLERGELTLKSRHAMGSA